MQDILQNKRTIESIVWIYCLLHKGQIIYIWQSENIPSRIYAHLKTKKIFDSYSYINCNKNELLELENLYIKKYNPIYNIWLSFKECGLTEIKWNILVSSFKTLVKRIYKYSWKRGSVPSYISWLYWVIDFKENIDFFLKREKIKLSEEEILKMSHWLRFTD